MPKNPQAATTLGKRGLKNYISNEAIQSAMKTHLNNGVYDPALLMAAISYVNQYYHLLATPPALSPSLVYPFPPAVPFMHYPMMPPTFNPDVPPSFLCAAAIAPFPFDSSHRSTPNPSSLGNSRASSFEDLEIENHSLLSKSKFEYELDPELASIYGEDVKDIKKAKTEEK